MFYESKVFGKIVI